LLTIKQTGGYIGYVGKFREPNRIVQIDDRTAINLFLNGLSDMEMKREILRKKTNDLNSAIEGFLEWELREKTSIAKKQDENRSKAKTCGFCGRGPHQVEGCWFKHPEKRPKPNNLNKQIFAMLEKMVVGDNQTHNGSEHLNE
ncbi:hypothetical protein PHMEG_00040623, partial [Phytophthora megakarya]